MDHFTYTLAVKNIATMKTLKAKDAFIRKCYEEISFGSKYLYVSTLNRGSLPSIILLYKCITEVLLTYDEKRLPFNIQSGIDTTKNYLVNEMLEASVSYETFIDAFQFITYLKCPPLGMEEISKLATTYGSNPMTFAIDANMYISGKFQHAITNSSVEQSEIMQIEEIKRSLPSTTRYTILEDLLDTTYAQLYNTPEEAAAITTKHTTAIIQEMQNLVTVATTMHKRVHG